MWPAGPNAVEKAFLTARLKGPFRGARAQRPTRHEAALKAPWEAGKVIRRFALAAATRIPWSDNEKRSLGTFAQVPKGTTPEADYRTWSKTVCRKWLYGTAPHLQSITASTTTALIFASCHQVHGESFFSSFTLALDDADVIVLANYRSAGGKSRPEVRLRRTLWTPISCTPRNKRQVIMVTHNANLVVNTDCRDQTGCRCTRGTTSTGRELPPITYTSGGLESAHIPCRRLGDIPGSGERAFFSAAARRLRVRLER